MAWPPTDRPFPRRGSGASDAGRGDNPRPAGAATQASAAHDGGIATATIVVVDDERDIRFLLRFVLEKRGYRVCEAVHGANALDVIRAEQPALVITDLMMPVMDGGELAGSLRDASETAHIPTILVSACPERAPHDYFDRVMRKPFLPSELVAVVEELLSGDGR